MHIRPATLSDISDLAKIYANTYNTLDLGETWTNEAAAELLTHYFNHQSDLCYTAENDSVIVGAFFTGLLPWYDGLHLCGGELFVDSSQRGNRVGTALLKTVFQAAIDEYQIVAWEAESYRGEGSPLDWYQRLGFEVIPKRVVFEGNIQTAMSRLADK